VDTVLLILCGGYPIIVVVASAAAGNSQWSLHLIPEFLQHPHELIVHFIDATTATAGHLIDGEIGGDHVSHEHPSSKNKCTA